MISAVKKPDVPAVFLVLQTSSLINVLGPHRLVQTEISQQLKDGL